MIFGPSERSGGPFYLPKKGVVNTMKAAVYAGTKNLYSDMVTAAKSLVMNSGVDEIYFLIESDTFSYYLPPYVKTINVSKQRYFPKTCPNVYKKWSYMTLMRCVLPKYLPNLDRILWLDVDTIVQDNIDELWDLDLTDYYFTGSLEAEKSTPEKPYINAGVMMINLKKLRQDGMDDILIDALNTKKFDFADQDCINELCQDKILVIPSTYNANDYTEKCTNPKIRHFAAEKDWRENPILYQYRNRNWCEMRKTTCDT